MAAPPIPCTWDGDAFIPMARFAKICDREFIVGQSYPLVVNEERSRASHNQYFASIHDAWLNLPEAMADRFLTEEHLRKWALINAGYADEQSFVCTSQAEALRLAAFMAPIDEYAVIIARGKVVKRFTAQSQSTRAMGKHTFQASKQAVLDIVSAMIEVEPAVLASNAGRAA